MKALVTGGAGFIGRWLVKTLVEEGIEVAVVDNLSQGSPENIAEFLSRKEFINFFKDSVDNERLLQKVFKIRFDLVFHLAASINVQDSLDHPEKVFKEDTVATVKLLERCLRGRSKFIFMSTCMVYDAARDRPIHEEYPTLPRSPYAGAKLAAEKMVLSYYYAYGLPVIVLRPFNTYGPYQKTSGEGGVIATFLGNIKEGKPISIYGDGAQTRDFLYVEDCARFAYLASMTAEACGEIINAGSGRDIAIKDLARKIDSSAVIKYVPHHHPRSEIRKMVCDSGKAKRILGWEARISLEEGLKKTRAWVFKE
jgi:nucleoside-diphosphate-sugar epimerase